MDERIREHARVLIEWSARTDPGDDVVVRVGEDAHELGVAVAERLGAVGPIPSCSTTPTRSTERT